MTRSEATAEAIRRWGRGSGANVDQSGHFVYAGALLLGKDWKQPIADVKGRGASYPEAFADADAREAARHPLSRQSGARELERERREMRERATRAGIEIPGEPRTKEAR